MLCRTLLAELGLALLDGGHDQVANGSSGQTIQTTADAWRGDRV